MAMEVLGNPGANRELWSEAVKWLLLFGPPRVKEILGQASTYAFNKSFPELQAKGYSDEGQPYYDLKDFAEALGVAEDEVADSLAGLQFEEGVELVVEGERVYKVH